MLKNANFRAAWSQLFFPRARVYALVCVVLLAAAMTSRSLGDQPNVIFVLADDVGIGDLGPYGQQTIQTPHLDQLATDGMRFSQMYSGAPVCSPSRAILMTGLHNGRHVNGNNVSLQEGNVTVAEVLKSAGYKTAAFGKWHMGGSGAALPTRQGFDEFYGILDGVAAWDHFNPNMQYVSSSSPNDVINLSNPGRFTDDLVGSRAADFVSEQARLGQPFYAQVNFQLAHFDMEVPELEPYTVDQPWPESRKIFASMISRLDRLVGDIVRAVEDPNGDGSTNDSAADDTLIIFASDNGTHIEPQDCCKGNHGPNLGVFSDDPHDPEFFDSNGQYRGWKRDLYDGGIKTPFIARWAGTIDPGQVNDSHFGDFADFLPTVAELAGAEIPVGIDGQSYAHVLTGSSDVLDFEKDFQFFEGAGSLGGLPAVPPRRALIRDGMKAIEFTDGHIELYDLQNDPSESNDLFAADPTLAQELIDIAADEDTGQINYRTWRSGNFFHQPSGWLEGTAAFNRSIASLAGLGTEDADLYAAQNIDVLGLDIGTSQTPIRLVLLENRTLAAPNGIRIRSDSVLRLEQASASTERRLEIAGGSLTGQGALSGVVVNRGRVAPDAMVSSPPPLPEQDQELVFNFAGIQDDAPLTQTTFLDSRLMLTGGLDFGPGTLPRSAGPDNFTGSDQGNEFNVGGFDAPSLSAAIGAQDYLTFSVQPVAGFEMTLDSVSFDLWRNGGNAANDYAILTSIDGFSAGSELAQLNNVFSAGIASQQTFTGDYDGGQAVTDPVEVRLYGWNANDNLANTHITAVSLDATFTVVDGAVAAFADTSGSPVGSLTLDGDYLQLEEGMLRIDLGGTVPGTQHDQLIVTGDVHLDGTLEIAFVDLGSGVFAPSAGDTFDVLEFGGTLTGSFHEVELPSLPNDLEWFLQYRLDSVRLITTFAADFDFNGRVDDADLAAWQNAYGVNALADADRDGDSDGADMLKWQRQFGLGQTAPSAAVPEPGCCQAVFTMALLLAGGRRRSF